MRTSNTKSDLLGVASDFQTLHRPPSSTTVRTVRSQWQGGVRLQGEQALPYSTDFHLTEIVMGADENGVTNGIELICMKANIKMR